MSIAQTLLFATPPFATLSFATPPFASPPFASPPFATPPFATPSFATPFFNNFSFHVHFFSLYDSGGSSKVALDYAGLKKKNTILFVFQNLGRAYICMRDTCILHIYRFFS